MNEAAPLSADGDAVHHVWAAEMIRPLADQGVGTRASFLRRSFTVPAGTGPAILRISALGLYRAFINGKRVGHDQLTPGWTCYKERLSYQTYDVTDLLQAGDNTIDIWLGDGWMRSQMGWKANPVYNTWGAEIGAIAELRRGPDLLLKTDATWTSGLLPILKSGIYFGEIYDARQEALTADQGSAPVAGFDQQRLIAHEIEPVQELEPLPVVGTTTDAEGRTIYDFGQNSGGYVAFTVKGERGAKVIVEHSEVLDKEGRFYNQNLRSAECRLGYTLKGGGEESYRPTFTFQGFRYARVTIEGKAELTSIVSVPITSAIHPSGSFSSGNALVNRLVQNTIWSQRANFIEVPTDCPQRDERLGWTGDAQVFSPTACYFNDSHAFLAKWLRDVMADQRPDGGIAHVSPDPYRTQGAEAFYGSTGWGDAICIVPWVLYTHYGDRDILAETFPAMLRWNDFVWSISNGPIVRPPSNWAGRGFTFGDWLQPQNDFLKAVPTMGDDEAATIYLYISSQLIARIAEVLGDEAQAKRLRDRAAEVKAAFQNEFITGSGRIGYDDQSSYALAFMHDLIPAEHIEAAKGYFKATIARAHGRIGTGFIGTPALLPALVKIGEPELAAAVFLQEEVPGWLYQVKRGATTIWERWDAIQADGSIFDPAMNSYNHYAYGAVCQWLFEGVAGFRPDEDRPGFRHIVFEPTIVPALSPVEAHHDSPIGRIEAAWHVDGDRVAYRVAVPPGAEGTLVLAARYGEVAVDGRPVAADADGKTRHPLGAGAHEVTFRVRHTGAQASNAA
ncbi:MAG: family 78 glycoside hydrolase catalytic domain [Devosia sp.]|nr:family 78 glycoside hydrolase catalytic domain [Devosia sp.]